MRMLLGILICVMGVSLCAPFAESGVYEDIYRTSEANAHSVKEITYDEFQSIRSSGEEYILFDVLSADSYANGHIEGAENLPVEAITAEAMYAQLPPDSNLIVYCGSFRCSASTSAAQKLQALGYSVLDYKGGIAEWVEKGNVLISEDK
jgi:rhodanese-related sulfurtransferase